jgi:hypothetical protein
MTVPVNGGVFQSHGLHLAGEHITEIDLATVDADTAADE